MANSQKISQRFGVAKHIRICFSCQLAVGRYPRFSNCSTSSRTWASALRLSVCFTRSLIPMCLVAGDTLSRGHALRTSERATQLTSRFQIARRLRLRKKRAGPISTRSTNIIDQLYRSTLSTNIIDQCRVRSLTLHHTNRREEMHPLRRTSRRSESRPCHIHPSLVVGFRNRRSC